MVWILGRLRSRATPWMICTILWSSLLLVSVFAASMRGLLHFQSLSFTWDSDPDWKTFWSLDFLFDVPEWWVTKLGHFVGFGVEEILLYKTFGKRALAIVGTILFALWSEFMQIPLGRDGRFYDVLIDTSGVLASWWYQSRSYYRWFWYDV